MNYRELGIVCVSVCTQVCVSVHVCVYMPASVDSCCVHVCVHSCLCACMHAHVHACVPMCVCGHGSLKVGRRHSTQRWGPGPGALPSRLMLPYALAGTLTAAPLGSRPAAFLPPAVSTPGKMEPQSMTSVASGPWAWMRTRPRGWCTWRAAAPHSSSGCTATSGLQVAMPSWSWWSRGQSSCWPPSW